jgi:arylsulfatase A-like enzyme
MKKINLAALIPIALSVTSCIEKEPARPNIIIIYADDMGYGDLGVQNPDSKIPTPNLDQLASEGMRFTDAHSPAGVCTPSRYSLLTGRYHWRHSERNVGSFGNTHFDQGRLTLPDMLREKGYYTACIGKWHLGWNWEAIRNKEVKDRNHPDAHDWSKPVPGGPIEQGFDYYFGDGAPNFPPYTWIENDSILQPPTVQFTPIPAPTDAIDGAERGEGHDCRPGPMAEGWRLDEVMPVLTDKTVEWIGQQSAEQPFFLYWSWTAPHTPVVPIKEFQGSTEAGPYGDFMYQVDAHLGQVLQALEENGFADNTLVIFSSDNGPESIAYPRIQHHDHYSMGPLRGVKVDVWEAGHRVPFIVRWPGVVEANTVSHELVSQIDIMSTLASLVGYKLPDNAAEDSHNLLPMLRGESNQSGRETLVHHTWKEPWGIRHGDWIYINTPSGSLQPEPEWRGYTPNPHEDWLNNIREDLSQQENLVNEYPKRADSLRIKLKTIRESAATAPRLLND